MIKKMMKKRTKPVRKQETYVPNMISDLESTYEVGWSAVTLDTFELTASAYLEKIRIRKGVEFDSAVHNLSDKKLKDAIVSEALSLDELTQLEAEIVNQARREFESLCSRFDERFRKEQTYSDPLTTRKKKLTKLLQYREEYLNALAKYCPPAYLEECKDHIRRFLFNKCESQSNRLINESFNRLERAVSAAKHLDKSIKLLEDADDAQYFRREIEQLREIKFSLEYRTEDYKPESARVHERGLIDLLVCIYLQAGWKPSYSPNSKFLQLCVAIFHSIGTPVPLETIRTRVKENWYFFNQKYLKQSGKSL